MMNESGMGGTLIQTSQYCIVSYRGSLARLCHEKTSEPLLLAIFNEFGQLNLYRNLQAESLVDDEDRPYIEFLFKDLKSRTVSDPRNLFRHLQELNGGPLVTESIGAAGGRAASEIFSKAEFSPL